MDYGIQKGQRDEAETHIKKKSSFKRPGSGTILLVIQQDRGNAPNISKTGEMHPIKRRRREEKKTKTQTKRPHHTFYHQGIG